MNGSDFQSHSVFYFSQHFGHGRELELAPTGRGFREEGGIIGGLNFGHGRELELAPTGRGFREEGGIIGGLNGSDRFQSHSVSIFLNILDMVASWSSLLQEEVLERREELLED